MISTWRKGSTSGLNTSITWSKLLYDGRKAFESLQYFKYDLAILDSGLPNMTGIEICTKYRAAGGITPILMLTGRDDVEEKATVSDSGADDYLTKPFHSEVTSFARIRALLRRPAGFSGEELRVSGIELNTASHKAKVNGNDIS